MSPSRLRKSATFADVQHAAHLGVEQLLRLLHQRMRKRLRLKVPAATGRFAGGADALAPRLTVLRRGHRASRSARIARRAAHDLFRLGFMVSASMVFLMPTSTRISPPSPTMPPATKAPPPYCGPALQAPHSLAPRMRSRSAEVVPAPAAAGSSERLGFFRDRTSDSAKPLPDGVRLRGGRSHWLARRTFSAPQDPAAEHALPFRSAGPLRVDEGTRGGRRRTRMHSRPSCRKRRRRYSQLAPPREREARGGKRSPEAAEPFCEAGSWLSNSSIGRSRWRWTSFIKPSSR